MSRYEEYKQETLGRKNSGDCRQLCEYELRWKLLEAKQAESGKWSQRITVTQSGAAKMAGD